MEPMAPGGRDAELLRAMLTRIDQQDPGAFNNLGVLYHSKGLYAEAVDAFLRALALDPRMRTAARNLEIAATRDGACDSRLASLAARLEIDADDVVALRERARLLRLIGRHTEASQQLDALIAADPDDTASLFERGLIEQRAGDLRRAQRWFERAVNVSSGDPIPRLHLAEVLYQRGQNEQALEALESLLTLWPNMADAHLLHGFVLGDMGRHEAARDASRKASALNPSLQTLQPDLSLDGGVAPIPYAPVQRDVPAEGALARYGLGLAFRQRGYFDEARREFERALAQGEDARLARHAIAELDLVAGRFADARAAYEQLLQEQADQPRLWNERGAALHQGGDVEGAAESYRRALRIDPRYAIAYNNLGVALSDLGEASAAREALLRAVELDAALARPKLNLARWYVRHRDPLAALSLLREFVAFHADNADAWHDLGVVFQLLHRTDEARDALARAIELRPDHAEARYALAQVLASLGDDDGALRETQRALGLAPVRVEPRLIIVIALQLECPEAAGLLDLLAIAADVPLAGVSLDEQTVAGLLPQLEPVAPIAIVDDVAARITRFCEEGDAFAARRLHGEAGDRYAAARGLLEGEGLPAISGDGSLGPLWHRAVVGEARSLCLLGSGHHAMSRLRGLAAQYPEDAEVVALFASSAAAAAARQEAPAEVVPVLLRRLLRLETDSAALLHFAGDTAVSIGDGVLALACYRRALAIDPTRPSPRVAIARVLRHRGDLQAARLELVAALATAPEFRDALLELARVNLATRTVRESVAGLTRHLAAVPTDLDALVLLIELLVAVDRDADARVAVSRVLRHDAEHVGALWFDGVLLARQSRMREAVDRWMRVQRSSDDEFAPRATKALAKVEEREQLSDLRKAS